MADRDSFRVDIKESAYEEDVEVRRLLEDPDGTLDTEREFQSKEAAELEAIRLSELGNKKLRLQPADHDPSEHHAYIVSKGRSSGGYGRTTRNASSGWEYSRKVTIERDEFTCQECGEVGGPESDVQLHVDHITARVAGGSDDPENLRTVCRRCHMSMHGSTQRGRKVTEGEIAESIIRLTEEAKVPAFKKRHLYDDLKETLTGRIDINRMTGALNTLIRYDRLEQIIIDDSFERRFSGETVEQKHRLYYLVTERLDPSLLTYSGGVKYGGELIKNGKSQNQKGRQTDLDEFCG